MSMHVAMPWERHLEAQAQGQSLLYLGANHFWRSLCRGLKRGAVPRARSEKPVVLGNSWAAQSKILLP